MAQEDPSSENGPLPLNARKTVAAATHARHAVTKSRVIDVKLKRVERLAAGAMRDCKGFSKRTVFCGAALAAWSHAAPFDVLNGANNQQCGNRCSTRLWESESAGSNDAALMPELRYVK